MKVNMNKQEKDGGEGPYLSFFNYAEHKWEIREFAGGVQLTRKQISSKIQ